VVNHLSLPTSLLHSYPVFGGVQDALVQWWYGHNAVAFFLTTADPRHHVLLRPQGRGTSGVRLPAVDHPLLVADLPLHLGRAAPPAEHRAPELAAGAWA
jgi:hypothetical protein